MNKRAKELALLVVVCAMVGFVVGFMNACATSQESEYSPYQLVSVQWDGFPFIKWQATGLTDWPVDKKQNLIGSIYVNGKMCEHFRPGYTRQHLRNLQSGKYKQVIAHGDAIAIKLVSLDGKYETNELELTWP